MENATAFFQPHTFIFWIPIGVAFVLWILSLLGIGADTDIDFGDVDIHFLGMAKIPFVLILTFIFFIFGVMGLSLLLLIPIFLTNLSPFALSLISACMAIVPAIFLSAFISRKLQPLFQDYGTVTTANELIGKVAITDSQQVTERMGSAHLYVKGGAEIHISVRTFEQKPQITNGKKVLIIDFDSEKNIYYVEEIFN